MATINIEIKNLDKIRAAFNKAPQKMAGNLQQAIGRITGKLQREAKDIIRSGKGYTRRPFDTGTLFRSIFTEVRPLGGRVYTNLHYAIYPHEGLSTSRKYGRRPFMEDAAKSNIQFIEREINEAISKSLPR